MMEPFCRGAPNVEAIVPKAIYPAFAGLFKPLLQLSASHARDALDKTRAIFDETDRWLADGRQYLVGGHLTLADIALATAAAPVLLPANCGSPMPPFERVPSELQAIISKMRQYETARFVEMIFRKHRERGS